MQFKQRDFVEREAIYGVAEEVLGTTARELNLSKVAVIASNRPGFQPKLGKIIESLTQKGIKHDQFFNHFEFEPDIEAANAIANLVKGKYDGVVGMGGGTHLDLAKYVAAKANNIDKDLLGYGQLDVDPLPFIAIPTTGGTGSEVTNVSVLTVKIGDTEVKKPVYDNKMFPSRAIIDPSLSITASQETTASSGSDALTHLVESAMSANASWKSYETALDGIELVSKGLVAAYRDGNDLAARTNTSRAAYLGGLAMANSGISVDKSGTPLPDWSETLVLGAGPAHAVGLPIGARWKISHGNAVGMVLTHSMSMMVDRSNEANERLYEIALVLNGTEDPGSAVTCVRAILDKVDRPAHLSEFLIRDGKPSASEEDLKRIADGASANVRLLNNVLRSTTRSENEVAFPRNDIDELIQRTK